MSRATPQMRRFAERLIELETQGGRSVHTDLPAAFRICERLRPHLSMLMGKVGFRALLSRSLALAEMEVPGLNAVEVKLDGALEGVIVPGARVAPQEMGEGSVILVAQLLGLLVAFIGEDLTLRMIGELWPNLPIHELSFRKGDQK